jgi:hypothetical protein
MRKCFTLLAFFIALGACAQTHQQGVAALDFTINKTGVGILGAAGYNRNFSEQAYIQVRGLAEFGRMYSFKYTHFGADLLAYYNPFYLSDFVQVNAGAGLTGGFEKVTGINKGKNNAGGWMIGIKGAVEIEAFLSDQVGFVLSARQAYMVKKSLGNAYYEIGIGVRVFLNNYY